MLKLFYDTFTGTASRAARCDSFVGEGLVSRMLAIEEHGGNENLRGLGSQSVTRYVQE
jgi:hypothetical protein